ncbi:zinc finger protein 704-like [Lytechinus variegatus]|uniref:zinc finger protein 704-like n=1 Tax=Lytechinus variegatus TaxID=7654 RepID=UPI001BB142F1|nr:zinc finger protein 704-like [Lytechinus variegatus]
MLSNPKRTPKRSIIGTLASAMYSDGIFYPVLIRGIKARTPTGEFVYEVVREDGVAMDCQADTMVGPGFLPVSHTHLKFNQPVYTNLDGREVKAIVQKHRKQTNEVLLKSADASETNFKRKLDDVRLLESRKIVKLTDHHHNHHLTDSNRHDRLGEICPEPKKRPVSTTIEVPSPSAKTQKTHEAEPPMDDVMAAMVLTSLFGSPKVDRERNPSGDSVLSGGGPMSPASSFSSGISPSPSPSINAHFTWDLSRSTPSPSSSNNSDMESMPCPPFNTAQGSIPSSSALFSSSVDEGIDISGGGLPFSMEDNLHSDSPTKKFKPSVKTSYKCTWQGCGKTLSTVQGIERHIRTIHLRKKEGEEYSDHEEEFYYTEIDTTVESVSDTLANMFTSSPPPSAGFVLDQSRLPHPHSQNAHPSVPQDISQKPMEVSSPSPIVSKRGRHLSTSSDIVSSSVIGDSTNPPLVGSLPNQAIAMIASPVSIPSTQAPSFSWCPVTSSPTSFSFPSSCSPPSQPSTGNRVRHKSAPHSSAGQPKIRSEGKKCRKVYGMENRDMWCTQCRWKKACVRFT